MHGTKDFVDVDGKRVHQQKKTASVQSQEAYCEFKGCNPGLKVSFSSSLSYGQRNAF